MPNLHVNNNISSVRNSHAQELTLILKIIDQCDIKHILTSQTTLITPVLKISTYIITCIMARPVGLACDTSYNVCLDLQNCRYSIYISAVIVQQY
jgi:hypothetical protein